MKIDFCRILKLCAVGILLSVTQACAETPLEHETFLLQKAIRITSAACAVYPAINDTDACVDKAVRKLLADRGVTPKQADDIIRDQADTSHIKHPPRMGDMFRTKEQLHQRALVHKLIDIIRAACAVPPAIANIDLCMDKAYHSILSSRDPHSGYLNPEEARVLRKQMSGEMSGIGLEVVTAKDKAIGVFRVMQGSPAERAGILDGDRIVAIIDGNERMLASSFANVNEATKKIKGMPNTKITLEILRGEAEQPLTITVVRGAIILPMVKTDILAVPNAAEKKYAYIRLVQFGGNLREKMVRAVRLVRQEHPDIKGVIFGLRGNLGGYLDEAYEAVDALLDSKDALVSIRTNDGIHAYGSAPDERVPEPQPGDITNGLPIGVLIDGYSASASEMFAGALKKLERSVTIGTGTWRKGTAQHYIDQPDGSLFKMTFAEYLVGSPTDWIAVQCIGVNPDIEYEAKSLKYESKNQSGEERHECDAEGSVVSGGASSDPNRADVPLQLRDPVRYGIGLEMLEAIKAFDEKELARTERIRKLLKIEDEPPGESE